ncbi:MAG: amino acid amidase [Candidatus Epulonipiscium fishelsonii]|nr:MAG: amino acid amidase [Epulopiscium sp. AS2M-Bin002]
MKIYISADIEGITGVSTWQEADMLGSLEARRKMTQEVKAACIAAYEAGATEIIVKDAHGYGKNINHEDLPLEVKLISGWSNHPYNMLEGLDDTYSGVILIGYHSSASNHTSPLAHTLDTSINYIKINNNISSEFSIYAQLSHSLKVPIITVTGDGGLIRDVIKFDPNIEIVAVQEGFGGAVISINPKLTCQYIKNAVIKGIEKIGTYEFKTENMYELEISFKNHKDAYKYSFFPNVEQIGSHEVKLQTNNYFEILRFLVFI